jgi:hypothetical protein
MESKKNVQFNDDFEIFILCFLVSHGAIEHGCWTPDKFSFISHFQVYHTESWWKSYRDSGAAGSSICAGNWQYIFTMAFLSAGSSQILIELELSQEVNSWQGLPVASTFVRYSLRKKWHNTKTRRFLFIGLKGFKLCHWTVQRPNSWT